MEQLTIYITLKEMIALKRIRKFEALYSMYLKKRTKEKRGERILRVFLDKRREIIYEISTRFYEEERKKAEDGFIRVK